MSVLTELMGGERYFGYVAAAYGATALAFAWMVARAWWHHRARRRRLDQLGSETE